jgi:hypothetical protein
LPCWSRGSLRSLCWSGFAAFDHSAEPLREAPSGQLPLLLSIASGGELLELRTWCCMGLRIRWQLAAKGAAVALAGFIALQLGPALLEPPAPEPLPADVGLPRVVATPKLKERKPKRHLGRVASGGGVSLRAESAEGSAHPLGGSRPSTRSRSQPKRGTPPPRQDPPAETSVPAASPPTLEVQPSAAEAPTPAPAPTPADDGSMEFAPR